MKPLQRFALGHLTSPAWTSYIASGTQSGNGSFHAWNSTPDLGVDPRTDHSQYVTSDPPLNTTVSLVV